MESYPYFIIYITDNPAHNKEVETEWSLRSLQPKPFYDNIKETTGATVHIIQNFYWQLLVFHKITYAGANTDAV